MLGKFLMMIGMSTIAAALLIAPVGAQDDVSPEAKIKKPAPMIVRGTWSGTVSDNVDGPGTMTFDLTQAKSTVGGTWNYQTSDHDITGFIANGKVSGSTVSMALKSGKPRNCNIHTSITVTDGNTMTGSYLGTGKHCQASGTFDLTLQ